MPLAYPAALFAAAGLFLVAPTFLLFRIAYDYVSASVVVAESAHVDEIRTLELPCTHPQLGPNEPVPAPAANACPHVFDGEASKPQREAADFPSTWLDVHVLMPLLERFPPLAGIEGDRSARWYRREAPSGDSMRLWSGDYDWLRVAMLVATFIVFGLLAHWIAYRSIRRLFFIDVLAKLRCSRPPLSWDDLVQNDGPKLVLYPPQSLFESVPNECKDLSVIAGTPSLEPGQWGFVRDIKDLLGVEEEPRRLGELLKAHRVLLFSSVDPWRRLPDDQRAAWADVLVQCRVVVCDPDPRASARPVGAALDAEVAPSEAAFIRQWNDSNEDEQRVLAQLAIDHHPSPHRDNGVTMGHLARRGLLDPCSLAIADRHFAEFVRAQMGGGDLDRIEHEDGPNAWKTLRLPLATAGSALLAMLVVGSPELMTTGIIFPAVFAATQVVLRALGSQESPPSA